MNIFITGATGYIGSIVVPELIKKGHTVIGLVRSDASANKLRMMGAKCCYGQLTDTSLLTEQANSSDAVIHLGFPNDFADYEESCRIDREAIIALGKGLEGSGKPFVVANGLVAQKESEEGNPQVTGSRVLSENFAMSFCHKDVKVSIVRLPSTVHGIGDPNFVTAMLHIAKEKGVSAYIGDGNNRWAAVHREDAAKLFIAALEEAPKGSRLHAVAEKGIPLKHIAEAIGKKLSLPVVSIAPNMASEHFGWLGWPISLDCPGENEYTLVTVAWRPSNIGLLEDIAENY